MKPAPIVILDEATSALDTTTEATVLQVDMGVPPRSHALSLRLVSPSYLPARLSAQPSPYAPNQSSEGACRLFHYPSVGALPLCCYPTQYPWRRHSHPSGAPVCHNLPQALKRATANTTCLIVAHRLSNIKMADRILVLGPLGQVQVLNLKIEPPYTPIKSWRIQTELLNFRRGAAFSFH